MTKPIASLVGATGVALFAAAILRAAGPTFWVVSTQADFLKGDVESVSIDEMGRVTLGPETTLVAQTAAPALWKRRSKRTLCSPNRSKIGPAR